MDKNISLIDETICAVCTPIGQGSVAVIRVSGSESFRVLKKLFIPRANLDFEKLDYRKMYLGQIVGEDNRLIDEVICIFFKSPNSYTGQDVVEIHTHGGRIAPQLVISALINEGVRVAEPGEFSFRSYHNGKIDLIKAEGVASLISSQSEEAVFNSAVNISGEIRKKFNNIRDLGINLLAEIEARVDFPEDEVPEIDKERIIKNFDNLALDCHNILDRYSKGRMVINGLRVLILGEPNVGKSTLLNAILSENKAIVSSQPGTTRDILEADITFNGKRIVFSDTAGIRSTDEEVEMEGIKRAKDKVDFSDLIIILADFDSNWRKIVKTFEFVPRGKRLLVGNKVDLSKNLKECKEEIEREIDKLKLGNIHLISAKEKIGVDTLLEEILSFFHDERDLDFQEGFITSDRQAELLKKALIMLANGKKAFLSSSPFELVSVDIREFLNLIGKITGEVTNEDIYDALFSKFCIGK